LSAKSYKKQNQSTLPKQPASGQDLKLSRSKRVLFTTAMLLLPVFLILLLEFFLRLFNYGGNINLVLSNETDPRFYRLNYEIGKQYFPRQNVSTAISYDVFRKEKPDNGYRIFVLGGSSAAGYPYMHNGAFSRMLRTRLKAQFPDRLIEIVNAGMPAVNSFTVLDFAKQLIHYQPDAFLLYTGHNEFYGALGVGSTETPGQSRQLIKFYLSLQRFRTFRLLRNFLNRIRGLIATSSNNENNDSTLMERMVGEQEIIYQSEIFQRACKYYRANLTETIQLCREKGIDIILGELVANVCHQKPFVSVFRNDQIKSEWRKEVEEGIDAKQTGQFETALACFEEALKLDAEPALLHFFIAQCYENLGKNDSAKIYYYQAKDRDALRFRAPEKFNRILRNLSNEFTVPLVPLVAEFEDASPHFLIGDNLMTDHLHPTLDGYFLIARAFATTMHKNHLITANRDSSLCPPDSILKEQTGITPLDVKTAQLKIDILKGGWPFQPKGTVNTARQIQPRNFQENIINQWLHHQVNWEQAHVEMAEYYFKQNQLDLAADEYFALMVGTPYNDAPYLKLAEIRIIQQRFHEALTVLKQSLQVNETTYANKWVGTILLNQGDAHAALPYLEKAAQMDPNDQQIRYNLSGAYFMAGQAQKALETGHRLLRVNPDYPGLKEFLNSLERANK
jgi:tetratricopeptide (TPR) repeat protein